MKALLSGLLILLLVQTARSAETVFDTEYALTGERGIAVKTHASDGRSAEGSFVIEPAVEVSVSDEVCERLPLFNPKAWGGWQKGYALQGVKAQECTVRGALVPASLQVYQDNAAPFEKGVDYESDLAWGSVGRLAGGKIGENDAVTISYRYWFQRIDSVVWINEATPRLVLKKGGPNVAQPLPPSLADGETVLLNILVQGGKPKLTAEDIFVVQERNFPRKLAEPAAGVAELLLPQTMKKLRDGTPLKILAWGDSVTEGRYLPEPERWQNQFVSRLRERYPRANIELMTNAWSGHSTADYLAAPAASAKNYKERILGARPDLIVMEFLNDVGLKTDVVNERYGRFLKDFKGIGAEWIVCAPHYLRPDWMGLKSQQDVDEDPREYVKALRAFTAQNQVPLADVSLRYGRLWRQGMPYLTLMKNAINHPDQRGLAIYADTLMNLFP